MSVPWANRLITRDQLTGTSSDGFGEAARALHRWQTERWPRLAEAMKALAEVETRQLEVGERTVKLQWNPGRLVSTTARVDPESFHRRPCVLCHHNLAPEQKGLAFGEHLVVLANPAPILPLHFTVAHRRHVPQNLLPVLGDAIRLAVACAGVMNVFYNGPRCGASAPEHLHLQAVASNQIPDELELAFPYGRSWRDPAGRVLACTPALHAWSNRDSSRSVLVFSGTAAGVERGLRMAVDLLADLNRGDGEPPLNLLLRADGDMVSALLYPRGAHRPACYFAKGADACLVSPGAIDMAGLVITVRQVDFQRLDSALIGQIYRETSLDPGRADELEERLRRRLEAVA